MIISVFSVLYPPNIIGGAEISAANLNEYLAEAGNKISVLTTSPESGNGKVEYRILERSIEIESVLMPRPYTALHYSDNSKAAKAVWHLLDHFDPRNRRVWADFLNRTKPEVAIVHITQGLGFNGLAELAARDIPTVFVLHDLSLACYRTTMFKNGKSCIKQCRLCSLSSSLKISHLLSIPRLGFVSPSAANLSRLQGLLPIGNIPSAVIHNANKFGLGSPKVDRDRGSPKIIYVGQVTKAKGVDFLISVCQKVKAAYNFDLKIIGDGPHLETLKSKWAGHDWIVFSGRVNSETVSREMSTAHLLCVPSLFADNAPVVIIEALDHGLPVLASDVGGIRELIDAGESGEILPAGDFEGWTRQMTNLLEHPELLVRLSEGATASVKRFSPELAAAKYLEFIDLIKRLAPRR